MLDEADDIWLSLSAGNEWVSGADESDLPNCLDEIQGGEAANESHEQYWQTDSASGADAAFMYDTNNEKWWSRTDDNGSISWNTMENAEVPEWVWAAAGMEVPSDEPWGDGYCNWGCPDYWIGDNYCDAACLTDNCLQDEGDCDNQGGSSGQCAPGCPDYWIGDNYCDSVCLNDACQNDGGDCDGSFIEMSMGTQNRRERKRKTN